MQFFSWDELLMAANDEDGCRRSFLESAASGESNSRMLRQLVLLASVLQISEASVLLSVKELAATYDQATFCLGQLVSNEPALVSTLPCAQELVQGLACAVRFGWTVHHGVGKFAANALAILAKASDAEPEARRTAINLLLSALTTWMRDTDTQAEPAGDVCGCHCETPALSATCWLDRLLGEPDDLTIRTVLEFPELDELTLRLVAVVRDERGNPFALTRLIEVPGMAAHLLKSTTCDPSAHLGGYVAKPPGTVVISARNLDLTGAALTGGAQGWTEPWTLCDSVCALLTCHMACVDDPFVREEALRALGMFTRVQGGCERLLAQPASLVMLELLATAACFLHMGAQILEALRNVSAGRRCLQSLGEALGGKVSAGEASRGDSTPSPAAAAGAPSSSSSGRGASAAGHVNGMDFDATSSDDDENDGRRSGASGRDSDPEDDAAAWSFWIKRELVPGKTAMALGSLNSGGGRGGGGGGASGSFSSPMRAAPGFRFEEATLSPVASFATASAEEVPAPAWPRALKSSDLATAWVILEVLGLGESKAAASLLARMDLSQKRVWLSRRLHRVHRGSDSIMLNSPGAGEGAVGDAADDWDDEPLVAIDFDRDAEALPQLRAQLEEGWGVGSSYIGSGRVEASFKGESSAGSAVMREWLSIVCTSFTDPKQNLLSLCHQGSSLRPSPSAAFTSPGTHLADYEVLGRIIGLALLHKECIPIRLETLFCRLLLADGISWPIVPEDTEQLDPEFYRNKVRYILDNDVTDLELDFTDVLDDRVAGEDGAPEGCDARVNLVPGGASVAVTEQNKHSYVQKLCEWRMFGSIARQTAMILRGLHAAVPPESLRQLSNLVRSDELADMVGGLASIDVEDWEASTVYSSGLTAESKEVRWFWQAVRDFSKKELEDLLQFATGSRRVPVGGFKNLQGFNGGLHRFTLAGVKGRAKGSLPTAHACICTVDIANNYDDFEALRKALTVAVSHGHHGFDERAVAEDGSSSGDDDDSDGSEDGSEDEEFGF